MKKAYILSSSQQCTYFQNQVVMNSSFSGTRDNQLNLLLETAAESKLLQLQQPWPSISRLKTRKSISAQKPLFFCQSIVGRTLQTSFTRLAGWGRDSDGLDWPLGAALEDQQPDNRWSLLEGPLSSWQQSTTKSVHSRCRECSLKKAQPRPLWKIIFQDFPRTKLHRPDLILCFLCFFITAKNAKRASFF